MIALQASDLSVTNQRVLARAISLVERGAGTDELLHQLHSRIGRAHICGVTGPPGAGKSTLVGRLAIAIRNLGRSVAIVAVDPSSPFSGGAVLGDRLRMAEALEDSGVYMRSLASRGHLGGVSAATADAITILDGAGFDVVIVETVGAGQSEVDIMRLAHTTIVVTVPGLGDRVQADKAGILEIADIFVVNKSDTPGVDQARGDLEVMLGLLHMGRPGMNCWPPSDGKASGARGGSNAGVERYGSAMPGSVSWRPPVIAVSAAKNVGTEEVLARIEQHFTFLRETGRIKARLMRSIHAAMRRSVHAAVDDMCFGDGVSSDRLQALQDDIAEGRLSVKEAARKLLRISGLAR